MAAIIDGTGSLGAAFGPLLAGIITDYWVSLHVHSCMTVMHDNYPSPIYSHGMASSIFS